MPDSCSALALVIPSVLSTTVVCGALPKPQAPEITFSQTEPRPAGEAWASDEPHPKVDLHPATEEGRRGAGGGGLCSVCVGERAGGRSQWSVSCPGLCAIKQIQKKCAHSYFPCVLSVFWSNERARHPEKGCPHFSWVVFRKLSDNCARFELNTVRRPTWSMAFCASC